MKYNTLLTILAGSALAVLLAGTASGQGNPDPLTKLPVIPAAEVMVAGKSYGFQPVQLPAGTVCKSKMQGNFYSFYGNVRDPNVKVSTVIAWYSAHLSGFRKTQGYVSDGPQNAGNRSQTAFYNAGGTIVVFVTGDSAPKGEDANAYSVAYQRYEPGISEKTIASLTQGKIVCQ